MPLPGRPNPNAENPATPQQPTVVDPGVYHIPAHSVQPMIDPVTGAIVNPAPAPAPAPAPSGVK